MYVKCKPTEKPKQCFKQSMFRISSRLATYSVLRPQAKHHHHIWTSIHPFIPLICFALWRVKVGLEPIPAVSGHEVGYTLER